MSDICPICLKHFDTNILFDHAEFCNDFPKCDVTISNNSNVVYIEPVLTSNQTSAFKYCKLKSKIHSEQTRGNILIKFISLGFDESDLNNVINYLKNNVRVTINIKHDTILNFLTNDEYIRNGFETNNVFGKANTSRIQWEQNLFNKQYETATSIEKVKYGALNLFNLPNGTASCLAYGDVFFVLKSELNNRISFVNGDSSLMMFHICTFKYPTALLVHLNDQMLKDLILYVTKNISPKSNYNYIEAQIHGPIKINTDIEKLVIPTTAKLSAEKINALKNFCFNNNIKIQQNQ